MPITQTGKKTYFKRNYLYDNGQMAEFAYKNDEHQMRKNQYLERLEKKFQRKIGDSNEIGGDSAK